MQYLTAVVFVACAAAVVAQTPFRCTSPDTWEARTYEFESRSSFTKVGQFNYDAPGQRISFLEDIYEGDEETASYYNYYFFKLRYSLRYNILTKTCSRSAMTMNETFHAIGVTATAKFLDTFIIGTNAVESLGLAVNVWGDNFGPNGRTVFEFVASDGDGDEDCFPISFTEFGGSPGSVGFRHQSFYNLVKGVNPIHFIPPNECQMLHE